MWWVCPSVDYTRRPGSGCKPDKSEMTLAKMKSTEGSVWQKLYWNMGLEENAKGSKIHEESSNF